MFISKSYKNLLVEVEDQICSLTINRPDKLNALNKEVLEELKEFLEHLIAEDHSFTVKGMIFTGAGEKAFIAGADIKAMSKMGPQEARDFGELGQKVSLLFEELHIPVIACVNGFALGGGCEMALSCDFIYATKSAVFGQPEVKLGLIPGFGGTQRLAKIIGRNFAKEIIYSGRNLTAEEAFERGLVTNLFEDKEEMLNACKKWFQKMKKNSPMAISMAKKATNMGVDLINLKGLGCELDQFSKVFSSEDMKEGTAAFLEKRSPEFSGK